MKLEDPILSFVVLEIGGMERPGIGGHQAFDVQPLDPSNVGQIG